MLFGLRYAYLLVDETISNRTEALQLLNRATGDVSLRNGGPIGGYVKGVLWSERWLCMHYELVSRTERATTT